MGTLLSALSSAGSTLSVFEQAMGVIQSNVSNASTPGYVSQTLNLSATSFQPASHLFGGVEADGVQDSRNFSAEQSVWTQNEALGTAAQRSSSLNGLQSLFSVSGTSGIPSALSNLYAAFSAWSTTPSSSTAQQQVLSSASQLTQAFNTTATGLNQLASQNTSQLESTVGQINQLTSQIAQINSQIQQSPGGADAGASASLYNDLEALSNLTDIHVQSQAGGTVSVFLGNGQALLVNGATQNSLSLKMLPSVGASNPSAPPNAQLLTASGQDVTSVVSQGSLSAMLQFQNTTLPSIIGNGTQQGSLNQLAQSIADQVNTLLTQGQISAGPPAAAGVPLFSYSTSSPTAVAQTLSVTGITGSQLAAINPTTGVPNGTADALAQLATPDTTTAVGTVNGMSYLDDYSSIASAIGSQASSAAAATTTQTNLLTQAQNLRSQISGVSLNEQAAQLLQFQQAYEASAQMVSTINQTLGQFMSDMAQA